jgi:hypothetical protein
MLNNRLLGLGLALLLGGCAGNVGPAGLNAGLCDTWDTNNDAFIDENEFGVGFDDAGVFDTWDADDSGFIENDEFGIDDDFGVWDTDDSFGLDTNEFGVGSFGFFDEDDNGMIGFNECEAGIGAF